MQTLTPGTNSRVSTASATQPAWRSLPSEGKWFARASGEVPVFAIGKDQPVELQAVSAKEFTVPGRYPLILRFDPPDQLVLNPGHWQQLGKRVSAGG